MTSFDFHQYDANGNLTDGGGRTLAWTSFNQVKRVQNASNTIFSEFSFGAGHERIKQVAHTGTTVYIGSLFERVTGTGGSPLVENKHYIYSPTGRIAVRTERNDTTADTRYFHTDGLGSITAVTDGAGRIVASPSTPGASASIPRPTASSRRPPAASSPAATPTTSNSTTSASST